MFSRVALHTGALRPVLSQELKKRVLQNAVASSSSVAKHLENWEKANKIYYGPERDTVNYPIKVQADTPPPTRLGFIPESFFQMFYEKTGVSGPYMLGIGLSTYLFSKELWIIEHGFTEFVAFWIAFYVLYRKVGPGLGDMLHKMSEDYVSKNWNEPLAQNKVEAQSALVDLESKIKSEEGQKLLYAAKKENVDLQLEAVYRQRLADVHQAVKRRLDYQAEVETAKTNFEQRHMANWIIRSVQESITPQQEKESITKCIADLKAMGARAQTA